MTVDHLHHDHERRDRRLRDGRHVADHCERDQHRQAHVAEHDVQQVAEPGADRQRRREDPARDARQVRRDHRNHLQERIEHRQMLAAVEQAARLGVAAAEGRAARYEADDGDREAAQRGECDRPLAIQAEQLRGQPAPRVEQQPAEQAACDPRHDRGDQHGERQQFREMRAGIDRAEIRVVAVQPERDDAGENDRGDQHAAGARGEAARQLLDREHDPGERRIERGRQPGRRAGEHQLALDLRVRARVESSQVEHQRRADLHGRPFAADREAAQDTEERYQHLAEQDAQRQQPGAECTRARMQRRDHLRDAAALGAAEEAARDPYRHRGDGRRQQ